MADTSDLNAGANAQFSLGEYQESHRCRAIGQYQVLGTANQTGTFRGFMKILITTNESGDAYISEYSSWNIMCGPSYLEAYKEGGNWIVNGNITSGGVDEYLIDEIWPLDVNTTIEITDSTTAGDIHEISAEAYDFEFHAMAGRPTPYSPLYSGYSVLIDSISLHSDFSVEP